MAIRLDISGLPRELQVPFEQLIAQLSTLGLFYIGTGSPNGVVTASPPAVYLNRSGGAGTTVYFKESGSATDTGWVGK
jgi:hypothetical protein